MSRSRRYDRTSAVTALGEDSETKRNTPGDRNRDSGPTENFPLTPYSRLPVCMLIFDITDSWVLMSELMIAVDNLEWRRRDLTVAQRHMVQQVYPELVHEVNLRRLECYVAYRLQSALVSTPTGESANHLDDMPTSDIPPCPVLTRQDTQMFDGYSQRVASNNGDGRPFFSPQDEVLDGVDLQWFFRGNPDEYGVTYSDSGSGDSDSPAQLSAFAELVADSLRIPPELDTPPRNRQRLSSPVNRDVYQSTFHEVLVDHDLRVRFADAHENGRHVANPVGWSTNPRLSQIGSPHGNIPRNDDHMQSQQVRSYHGRRRRSNLNNRGNSHRGGPVYPNNGPNVQPTSNLTATPIPKEKVVVHVYRSAIPNAIYTIDGEDHVVGEPSGVVFVAEGVKMRCKHSGSGWFHVSDDDSKNTKMSDGVAATTTVKMGGYRRKDAEGKWMQFGGEDKIIYTPLESNTHRFLPIDKLSPTVEASINAYTKRYMRKVWNHPVIISTREYILGSAEEGTSRLSGKTTWQTRLQDAAGVHGVYDQGLASNMVALGLHMDYYDKTPVRSVDSNHPLGWAIRQDVKIISARGINYYGGSPVVRGPITGYLRFIGVEKPRWMRTRYWQFGAPNIQLLHEHANTNENYSRSLFRLLETSPGDDVLRQNALHLGKLMRDRASSLEELDVRNVYTKLLNGRRMGGRDNAGDAARLYVAKEYRRLVARCKKGSLSSIKDGLWNGARYINKKTQSGACWAYEKIFSDHLTWLAPIESRVACAHIEHCKQKLRKQYVMGKLYHTDEMLMMERAAWSKDLVMVQLKRESAKKLRITMDYSAGCMYSNELPEFVKVCIDGFYTFSKGGWTMTIYIMAKPKSDSLEKAFRGVWSAVRSSGHVFVAIFSDDAITNYANLDLSRCDSRQDIPAFLAVYQCMRNFMPRRAEGLLDQCMVPMRLCAGDRDCSVDIQFDGPFLGSGTVLTTLLNHLVLFMICLAALYYLAEGDNPVSAFEKAAAAVGHSLTMEDNKGEVEHTVWLHRSATIIDGEMIPWTNLGCILKNFGLVQGDLEPRHLGMGRQEFQSLSLEERADRFFGGVIRGWQHEPGSIVMDALRERFESHGDVEILADSLKYVFEDVAHYREYDVTEAMCKHYDATILEFQELAECIRHLHVGQILCCSVLEKIYRVDYGAKQCDFDAPFYTSDWNFR